jgi:uncharacterized protein HemX
VRDLTDQRQLTNAELRFRLSASHRKVARLERELKQTQDRLSAVQKSMRELQASAGRAVRADMAEAVLRGLETMGLEMKKVRDA